MNTSYLFFCHRCHKPVADHPADPVFPYSVYFLPIRTPPGSRISRESQLYSGLPPSPAPPLPPFPPSHTYTRTRTRRNECTRGTSRDRESSGDRVCICFARKSKVLRVDLVYHDRSRSEITYKRLTSARSLGARRLRSNVQTFMHRQFMHRRSFIADKSGVNGTRNARSYASG